MSLAPRFRLLALLGMGSMGAVAGHLVGYWAAHPVSSERDVVLEASGHGYMEMAIAVALVAALVALLGQFALGFLDRRSDEAPQAQRLSRTWGTLALIQTLVFLGIEIAERALNGASLNIFSEPALWFGLPLQIGFAALGALLLTAVRKAGSGLAARVVKSVPESAPLISAGNQNGLLSSRWFGFSFLSRGPPAHSFS